MRAVVLGLVLLVLAACGGGADEPAAKPTATASTAAPTQPDEKPTTAAPTGDPAPEALSRFRCAQDDEDVWRASGIVANATKAKVTFQVTVFVGEATGGQERAKTTQLPNVAGGGSVEFTINKIPAPDEGGTCHVQVLASS